MTTQHDRQFYGDMSKIATNTARIATALEEIAAQNRDPEKTRADNLAAGISPTSFSSRSRAPHGVLDKRAEREALPECVVNRCTAPAVPGEKGCVLHPGRGPR